MAIKLGNKKPGKGRAFMDDFYVMSSTHPFDRRIRMVGNVGVEIMPFNGEIHLSDIRNFGKARQGEATRVLKMLTKLSKKHKIPISGIAKLYDSRDGYIMSTTELVNWYKKNGFTISDGSDLDGYRIKYVP